MLSIASHPMNSQVQLASPVTRNLYVCGPDYLRLFIKNFQFSIIGHPNVGKKNQSRFDVSTNDLPDYFFLNTRRIRADEPNYVLRLIIQTNHDNNRVDLSSPREIGLWRKETTSCQTETITTCSFVKMRHSHCVERVGFIALHVSVTRMANAESR